MAAGASYSSLRNAAAGDASPPRVRNRRRTNTRSRRLRRALLLKNANSSGSLTSSNGSVGRAAAAAVSATLRARKGRAALGQGTADTCVDEEEQQASSSKADDVKKHKESRTRRSLFLRPMTLPRTFMTSSRRDQHPSGRSDEHHHEGSSHRPQGLSQPSAASRRATLSSSALSQDGVSRHAPMANEAPAAASAAHARRADASASHPSTAQLHQQQQLQAQQQQQQQQHQPQYQQRQAQDERSAVGSEALRHPAAMLTRRLSTTFALGARTSTSSLSSPQPCRGAQSSTSRQQGQKSPILTSTQSAGASSNSALYSPLARVTGLPDPSTHHRPPSHVASGLPNSAFSYIVGPNIDQRGAQTAEGFRTNCSPISPDIDTFATPVLSRAASTSRRGSIPGNSSDVYEPNLVHGIWSANARHPTSLPPPPRSPSGSAGRRRGEELRRASQISELDLTRPLSGTSLIGVLATASDHPPARTSAGTSVLHPSSFRSRPSVLPKSESSNSLAAVLQGLGVGGGSGAEVTEAKPGQSNRAPRRATVSHSPSPATPSVASASGGPLAQLRALAPRDTNAQRAIVPTSQRSHPGHYTTRQQRSHSSPVKVRPFSALEADVFWQEPRSGVRLREIGRDDRAPKALAQLASTGKGTDSHLDPEFVPPSWATALDDSPSSGPKRVVALFGRPDGSPRHLLGTSRAAVDSYLPDRRDHQDDHLQGASVPAPRSSPSTSRLHLYSNRRPASVSHLGRNVLSPSTPPHPSRLRHRRTFSDPSPSPSPPRQGSRSDLVPVGHASATHQRLSGPENVPAPVTKQARPQSHPPAHLNRNRHRKRDSGSSSLLQGRLFSLFLPSRSESRSTRAGTPPTSPSQRDSIGMAVAAMAPSQMPASSGNDASRPSRSVSLSGPSKGAGLSTRPRGGSNASRSGLPRLLSSPSGSTSATGSGHPSSQHPLLRAPSRSSIVDHTHATNASLTLHMPERDITAAPPPVIEEENSPPAASRINGRSMQQRSVVRGEGKRAESEGASLGKRDKAAVREELRSISSRKSPRAEAAASPRSTSGFLSMKRMFGRSKSTSVSNGTRTDPSRGSATAQSRPEGLPEESSEFGGLSDDHKSKGNSGSTRTSRDSSRSLNSRGLFSSFRSRDSPRRNKMELSAAENNGQRSTRVGSEAAPAAAYAARATLSPAMEAPLRNGGRRSLDSVTSSHVGQADREGFARSTTPTFANTGVHAAGPSRSLTLQALSSASTSPYGSLASEQVKYPSRAQTSFSDALLSRQSTPVGVMQRDASAYSTSTDEGMGIALTAGSSTDLLTNSYGTQASRDPRPAVPKMWQLSRSSRNMGDMEDSEEQPEEARTAALAFPDSHGEGSRIDAHSRFTTMTSIASYRTATSGYADSRRGDLSTIADTSRGDSTGSRGVASNTAPSTQDSAALSDLITNLQRGERSPNIASFSSSAERGHAAPAIAAGPSPTPQLTPASSEREETMRRISDETSFDSPSVDSAHRRRNTFGGGPEAAATGWRTERSTRDSSQRDRVRDLENNRESIGEARAISPNLEASLSRRDLSVQEIESDLAAVERALQDHSIAGSFDPSSLRRRIGPPNHPETSMSLRSLTREGAPEDASEGSFAGRVTLPPGSELAIANAVRDVRRAISSSHLPRIPSESDVGPAGATDLPSSRSGPLSPVTQRSQHESTPTRNARVRQESMQDVEAAYTRMCELVASAAGIVAPSPHLGDVSWRRRSQPQPPVREPAKADYRTRVQSLTALSAHGQSLAQQQAMHNARATRQQLLRDADALSRIRTVPEDLEASEHAELRGRSSNLSTSSRRANSESPQRRVATRDQRIVNGTRRQSHGGSASAHPTRVSIDAPESSTATLKRFSNEPANSQGSGSGGTGAFSTSPSATIKTQGTPRSQEVESGRHSSEYGSTKQSPRNTRGRGSSRPYEQGADVRARLQGHSRHNSTASSQQAGEPFPTFEARPLALGSSFQDSRRAADDTMRKARAQLASASNRISGVTSPTLAFAGYRRPDSGSVRDWTTDVGAARSASRASNASLGLSSTLLARSLARMGDGRGTSSARQGSQEGNDSFTGDQLRGLASPAPSTLSAMQRRHALERDSLMDMLDRSRQEGAELRIQNEQLRGDLHQEVTRVLELERNLERAAQREGDQEIRIQSLEDELAKERQDRVRISELLENVQQALDSAANAREASSAFSPTASSMSIVQEDLQPISHRVFDNPSVLAPGPPIDHEDSLLRRQGFTSSAQFDSRGSNGRPSSTVPSSEAEVPHISRSNKSPSLESMPSALGLAVREHEMTWSLEDEEPLEGAFSDADEERLTGDGNGSGRPSSFRRRAPGQDRQASLGSISSNGKLAAPVARRPGQGDALVKALTHGSPSSPRTSYQPSKRTTLPASLSGPSIPASSSGTTVQGAGLSSSATVSALPQSNSRRSGLAERFGYKGPVSTVSPRQSMQQPSTRSPTTRKVSAVSANSRFTGTSGGDTSWTARSSTPDNLDYDPMRLTAAQSRLLDDSH